jgi:NADPH-dependent 2,4-dienoyl-CoA reductase/sulfur reductase-like enzyme
MRLVIAGGGPGALATARAYREAGGDGDVTLVTPEASLPYTRPALSKEFLRGEAQENDLPIEPPEWYAERDVTVRTDLVTAVRANEVALRDDTLRFDACVIATGATPKRPFREARVLRSLADARALRDAADGSATIIGSGFIGCEAAASLAMRGLKTTLISDEDIPHAARLGEAAGRRIMAWLEELGVELRLATKVTEPPDGLVLSALGIDVERIPVDERMRTDKPDVYAVGDVAHAHNPTAGRRLIVEHWGEALNMGEVAGRTIAGEDAVWDVAPGFWSTIGTHTLKYVAWGDGFDEARLVDHGGGAWTVWYSREKELVGVLTHERDDDYEEGRALLEGRA